MAKVVKSANNPLGPKPAVNVMCNNCIHFKLPSYEAVKTANQLLELTKQNIAGISKERMQANAADLMEGQCTFDPKWTPVALDHYCGQWTKK